MRIRKGPDAGKSAPLEELGLGVGVEASVGGVGTAIWYTGNIDNFRLEMFNGPSWQGGVSWGVVGASYSQAYVPGGKIIGIGFSVSLRNPLQFGLYGQSRHSKVSQNYYPPNYPWQNGKP